jgi:hypothetical protein
MSIAEYYSTDMASVFLGDSLEFMRGLPDGMFDLVMTSPPYEDARTYGIDFKIKGEEWVKWAFERYVESLRICKGLVCWVVEGKTRDFCWSATPAMLMADLSRAGVKLRKPPIFYRVGIPGSGGPDWLRNDFEFLICATHGKLLWSDNTACGHPPKWAPGGEMSNRLSDGARVNGRDCWGCDGSTGNRDVNGNRKPQTNAGKRPSHVLVGGRDQWGGTPTRTSGEGRKINGESKVKDALGNVRGARQGTGQNLKGGCATVPVLANPGNCIDMTDAPESSDIVKCNVGGGVMGSKLASLNEAPYPEKLCDFIIKSFCPPGGIVFDPFAGSGTTIASALKNGCRAWGIDIRENQAELSKRRIIEATASVASSQVT